MEPAASGGRGTWRRAVVVGVAAALVAALYVLGINLYFAAQHGPAEFVKNPQASQLDALVRTTSIDPVKGDLVLRVEVRPGPGLAGPDELTVTRPVSVDVVGSTGTASYRYGPGQRISPVDVTIGLTGNTNSYPFDSYTAPFGVVATAAPPTSGQQGASAPVTPTRLVLDGKLSGYRVKAGPLPNDVAPTGGALADVNALVLQLSITRAPLTAAFAILILVLQALLAVAAASLAIVIRRRHLRVEAAMLTWLAAMLFAIVPLRNAMPGAPPIGALVDVLVFFWAVTVISLSLMSVLLSMYRQRSGQQ